MNTASTPSSTETIFDEHLSEAQKEQLAELLERYWIGLEEGLPPSAESLTADQPELAEPLARGIAGIRALHDMAQGLDTRLERRGPFDASPSSPNAPSSNPWVGRSGTSVSAPQRSLGDFDLWEEIGRGGMGVVYRATQRSLRRTVAVKLLPFINAANANQIKRFQNEAEYAASLNHPNIVPVYSFGVEEGIHFYAMQWIDGVPLDRWSCNDWRKMVEIGIQAADGLYAAHEAGIIHRDVKPSNLLIDSADNVWLTDFGLARVPSETGLTHSGEVVGTKRYMSPEQAAGKSAMVDARSDIYSLGMTLYDILLHAYSGSDPTNDGTLSPEAPKPFLRRLQHAPIDLPPDLDTVLAKATAIKPEQRYESVQAFADDLQRVLDGKPSIARPPSLADRFIDWAQRHRQSVLVATAIGMLITVGSLLAASVILAEKQRADAMREQSSRSEFLARGAIDRLGSQMADLLSDIPSASGVRKRLLEETLAYYESFIANAGTSPYVQQELARTHGKIGAMQLELGLVSQALEHLATASDQLEELTKRDPDDIAVHLEWSVVHNNLGRAYQVAGQAESAAEAFGKALSLQRQRLSTAPERVDPYLAITENNLALLLVQSGSPKEAIPYFQSAMEHIESSDPYSERAGLIQMNLAGIQFAESPEDAVESAQHAVRIFESIAHRDPHNTRLLKHLAQTCSTLGLAWQRQERWVESEQSFRRALQELEQLVKEPAHPSAILRDMAICHMHLGRTYEASKQLDAALNQYELATTRQRAWIDASPNQPSEHAILASMLDASCRIHRLQGDIAQAKLAIQEAISQQSIATKTSPFDGTAHDSLVRFQEILDGLK